MNKRIVKKERKHKINNEIRFPEVRVIGDYEGEIMSSIEAFKTAQELGLDLILIKEFTCGKKYTLYSDCIGNLLSITSDSGSKPLPSYYSPIGYYFLPLHIYLHIWRELKINELHIS